MVKVVAVTQYVTVKIDESKFDDAFLQEFRDGFYNFDGIGDHIRHLGQLTARSVYPETKHWVDTFIEGYGPAKDMGIETSIDDRYTEIEIQDIEP